jgi:hypothetical protein
MGLQPPEQAHLLWLLLSALDRHRQRDERIDLRTSVGLVDAPATGVSFAIAFATCALRAGSFGCVRRFSITAP